jgi:hypothetical protein
MLIAKDTASAPTLLGKPTQPDKVFFSEFTLKLKSGACESIANFHT